MKCPVYIWLLFTLPAWAQLESQQAAEEVNRHAFEAFQLLRQMTKGNFCFSPFSGHQVAALLVEGAKDETKKQLLGMTYQPDDAALRTVEAAALREQVAQSVRQRGLTLEIANSIWAPPESKFLPTFQAMAKDRFGATAESLPSKDVIAAASTVNRWVRNKTGGRIQELVGPAAFGQGAGSVLLVNAVYLKALWSLPFDLRKTRLRAFQQASSSAIMVPTMLQSGAFLYAESATWKCLEIPFAGGDVSMRFLLPADEAERARIEAGLNVAAWNNVTQVLRDCDVTVMLPRFSFSTQLDLKGVWQTLGVQDVFDPARANLTDMIATQPCPVSQVVHESTIEVNEIGTRAAAATAAPADPFGDAPDEPAKRRRVSFVANRPFVWIIQDRTTGLILFLGRFAGE